jgi:hypothetical protein
MGRESAALPEPVVQVAPERGEETDRLGAINSARLLALRGGPGKKSRSPKHSGSTCRRERATDGIVNISTCGPGPRQHHGITARISLMCEELRLESWDRGDLPEGSRAIFAPAFRPARFFRSGSHGPRMTFAGPRSDLRTLLGERQEESSLAAPPKSEELTTETQRHREENTEKRTEPIEKDAREPIPESISGQTPDRSYPVEFSVFSSLCLCVSVVSSSLPVALAA